MANYAFIDNNNLVVNCLVFDENDFEIIEQTKKNYNAIDAVKYDVNTFVSPNVSIWDGKNFITNEIV